MHQKVIHGGWNDFEWRNPVDPIVILVKNDHLTRQNSETNIVQTKGKSTCLVPNRKEVTTLEIFINGLYLSFNTGQGRVSRFIGPTQEMACARFVSSASAHSVPFFNYKVRCEKGDDKTSNHGCKAYRILVNRIHPTFDNCMSFVNLVHREELFNVLRL